MSKFYNAGKRLAEQPKWLDDCIKGATGNALPQVSNVLIGLRADYQDHFCL
jgi:hypothetical protein